MAFSPNPQAGRGERHGTLGRESELRVRSCVVFQQINEVLVLGMHPVVSNLRRSQSAPTCKRLTVNILAPSSL